MLLLPDAKLLVPLPVLFLVRLAAVACQSLASSGARNKLSCASTRRKGTEPDSSVDYLSHQRLLLRRDMCLDPAQRQLLGQRLDAAEGATLMPRQRAGCLEVLLNAFTHVTGLIVRWYLCTAAVHGEPLPGPAPKNLESASGCEARGHLPQAGGRCGPAEGHTVDAAHHEKIPAQLREHFQVVGGVPRPHSRRVQQIDAKGPHVGDDFSLLELLVRFAPVGQEVQQGHDIEQGCDAEGLLDAAGVVRDQSKDVSHVLVQRVQHRHRVQVRKDRGRAAHDEQPYEPPGEVRRDRAGGRAVVQGPHQGGDQHGVVVRHRLLQHQLLRPLQPLVLPRQDGADETQKHHRPVRDGLDVDVAAEVGEGCGPHDRLSVAAFAVGRPGYRGLAPQAVKQYDGLLPRHLIDLHHRNPQLQVLLRDLEQQLAHRLPVRQHGGDVARVGPPPQVLRHPVLERQEGGGWVLDLALLEHAQEVAEAAPPLFQHPLPERHVDTVRGQLRGPLRPHGRHQGLQVARLDPHLGPLAVPDPHLPPPLAGI
mmetsp:Transcript_17297/g.43697  ORF Transcript_17297/g.43697 Transcript_17297/m.43697 type:complete len:534 (-) Transcript_17297:174-1775(-)